ncbi:hypothetical protein ES705_27581 [subsurface metagenome]
MWISSYPQCPLEGTGVFFNISLSGLATSLTQLMMEDLEMSIPKSILNARLICEGINPSM